MDFIDYLILTNSHKEFIDTMIMLFGIDEILTGLSFGTIILEDSIIKLNIQQAPYYVQN